MIDFLMVDQVLEPFWHGLIYCLDFNEPIEANTGYTRDARLIVKHSTDLSSPFATHEIQACVYNHQETVNKCPKQWGVLMKVW